jgi:hypothetical protein
MEDAITPACSCRRQTIAISLAAMLIGLGIVGWMLFGNRGRDGNAVAAQSNLQLEDIPFDGAQAYEWLRQLCAIGPRPSGSPGMETQQKMLAEHFQKFGGQVEFQRFRVPHPQTGEPVPMANMIVRWQPENPSRILLCAHYDTLPYPLRDRQNPQGVFVGANDNASGVAVLMELAKDMPSISKKYGVDFLLLDGEEFLFREDGEFFIGSQYFARDYARRKPPYSYRWAVLLDMIGDSDLQIYQERNSLWWKDTHPLVDDLWAVAARLGVKEFIAKPKHEVNDDHVMLHSLGKIPCIDVIDFDYPAWHTQADTPNQCSPLSLAKVGWVIREWLKTAR